MYYFPVAADIFSETYHKDSEGYYCCLNCNRKYKWKKGWAQHCKYECQKPPQFKCSYCSKKFRQKTYLKLHILTIHKQMGSIDEYGFDGEQFH